VKRLVLVGGGHSHVEVVRRFGARPVPNTEITLVDTECFATYSGMLPGLIAGHYVFDDCHIDLAGLAQRAGARFVQARAGGIDTARRQLALDGGNTLDYDLISLDVGSTPSTGGVAGAGDHAIPVKPFAAFARNWDQLIERARSGQVRKLVVVGGGAAGVELLLAMQHRLTQLATPEPIQFALVSDARSVVPDHNAGTRVALERLLEQRGIEVHMNARVARVEPSAVVMFGANCIAADAIIWATGAGAPSWFADTGLALGARGFVSISERLQSVSHGEVFAAGDCATMEGHAYPKSGVYAVRQGPVLAANLRNALAAKPLAKYRPQRFALSLISSGDKYAVASYGRFAFEGAWVWRWKNAIDRKFVEKYRAKD
jgi:selenide,water dikinase